MSSSRLGRSLCRPSLIGFCPAMYHERFFSASYLYYIPPPQFLFSSAPLSFYWCLISPPYPPLSGSLLITYLSHLNLPYFAFSLMFTTSASFLMSSFLLWSFNTTLHIFLNIRISVLVVSPLPFVVLLTLCHTTIWV